MIVELGVRVPLTNIEVGAMMYDPSGPSRDHAAAAGAEGADLVRDAGKPSASLLYHESPLDELLDTPSPLDKLLDDDRHE